MTIELFKGEDDLLLNILSEEFKKMGLDQRTRAKEIYKLIERIELTQRLYANMYGRGNKNE